MGGGDRGQGSFCCAFHLIGFVDGYDGIWDVEVDNVAHYAFHVDACAVDANDGSAAHETRHCDSNAIALCQIMFSNVAPAYMASMQSKSGFGFNGNRRNAVSGNVGSCQLPIWIKLQATKYAHI